jgi:hypothetical protein
MSATIIKFPKRWLGITVQRDRDGAWLVIRNNSRGWVFGDLEAAFDEARQLARADAVGVVVRQ